MRDPIAAYLILAVSGVIGACAGPEMVTPPIMGSHAPPTSEEQLERRRTLRPHRETLTVLHERHYGYQFRRASDPNSVIFAEIPDEGVVRTFDQFFFSENLGRHVGKRIYCDCAGELYDVNGTEYFIVHEARLFAE